MKEKDQKGELVMVLILEDMKMIKNKNREKKEK